jgi:hypothetical protein
MTHRARCTTILRAVSRRCAFPFLVLPLLLLAGCDAPTAARPEAAYSPTSLTGGVLYRWPNGSTLRVWVEPDADGELASATQKAMARWNALSAFDEFRLERASTLAEANVVVYDRSVANPMGTGDCLFDPRGSGYTYFCLTEGDGGVAMRLPTSSGGTTNVSVVISVDRGRLETLALYDAVVAHELGHALGIGGHSPDAGDLMFGAPVVSVPTRRDEQTLLYVLGQRPAAFLR